MVQVAAAFSGFFAGTGFLLPLGGTVLLAGGLAMVLAARLRPADMVVLAAMVGWVPCALVALVATRGAAGPSAFGSALRDGWADLLTVALPADPTVELLVVPSLVLWVVTVAAVLLVLRTDAVLLPLLPVVLADVLALVVTSSGGRSQLPLTGCLTFTALVLVLVRTSQAAGSAESAGWLTLGLPLVAGAAAAATLGASILPLADGDERFDPRDHREPPVATAPLLDPLAQVQVEQRANPPRSLFTARLSSTTGRLPVDRLRIAALGDFDGADWRDEGLFVRAGGTLPTDGPEITVATTQVGMDVTIDGWGGTLLPSIGVPVGLRGRAVSVQPGSGSLAAVAAPRAGDGYRLRAEVATPDGEALRLARAASGPMTDRYAALPPGLAPELAQLADEVTANASTSYDRLVALADYLRDPDRFPYDGGAPPGHSYGAVARLLGVTATAPGPVTGAGAAGAGPATDRRGYAEQHAAAFAVLARAQGFPTRIAVGYLLDRTSTDGPGGFVVTTRQAHAWPEVALDGIGWVGFEPTDISKLGLTLAPADRPATGGAGQQDLNVNVVAPVVVPQLDPTGAAAGGGERAGRTWPGYAAALLAAPLLGLALVPLEKRRRRWRRRRAGPPSARIAAAWREVCDRLTEHGLPGSPALTPREVAGRARELPACTAAAHHLGSLAPLVTMALFGAAEPGEDDAHRAWDLTRLSSRALGSRLGRIRASIDPRPLLPRTRQATR
ncbi:hypothetical protein CC117_02445 [Parafrankia colletiae]|uniref:Transglutaminase-like domain-containing protein n=2 Tax=Parafrankia colletiae TaxID=573497 RepID=A0A1S1QZB6_9ACTN|nr:hypothetical protein CC117_02445 [Parafrankia colletiae]